MVLPGLMAPIFAGGGTKLVNFVYSGYQTNANNNHDWASCNLGTPAEDRLLVVATFGYGSGNLLGMQLDSVEMNLHVQGVNNFDRAFYCGIASILVPDERTTGYLVVYNNGGVDSCFISVHTINGLESYTPFDTDIYAVNENTYDVNLSPNVPEDGCVVGIAGMRESSPLTATWTGLTKQYDVYADNCRVSSAHAGPVAGANPLNIVAAFSRLDVNKNGCAVSWA